MVITHLILNDMLKLKGEIVDIIYPSGTSPLVSQELTSEKSQGSKPSGGVKTNADGEGTSAGEKTGEGSRAVPKVYDLDSDLGFGNDDNGVRRQYGHIGTEDITAGTSGAGGSTARNGGAELRAVERVRVGDRQKEHPPQGLSAGENRTGPCHGTPYPAPPAGSY